MSELEEWLTGDVKVIDIALYEQEKEGGESAVLVVVGERKSFPNVRETRAHFRLVGSSHKNDLTIVAQERLDHDGRAFCVVEESLSYLGVEPRRDS